jgi:hypothetical protein
MDARLERLMDALGAILAGMILGAFFSVLALLAVIPLGPTVWLVGMTIGAVGGAGLALCFTLWFRRAGSVSSAFAKTR